LLGSLLYSPRIRLTLCEAGFETGSIRSGRGSSRPTTQYRGSKWAAGYDATGTPGSSGGLLGSSTGQSLVHRLVPPKGTSMRTSFIGMEVYDHGRLRYCLPWA
jgi:hypothetical protein